MSSFSLRAQVISIVAILAVGVTGAILYTAGAIERARESIVRLNRERLGSLTENLSRRHGSVINFIAPEQLEDSSLAHREELQDLLAGITGEELSNYPDVEAGFFHSLWNQDVGVVKKAEMRPPEPVERFLRLLIQNTLDQDREQWGHYESGEVSFVAVTRPVYSRQRLVGVAWALDDLEDELRESWRTDLTPLLQFAVLIGIILAGYFVLNLRREITNIQDGLSLMKENLRHRLPTPRSELGSITASINQLAQTILTQQQEKEELQKKVEQRAKLAALGQLIAGVAHEIRTPLSVIKTRVQLWQRVGRTGKTRSRSEQPAGVTPKSMQMVVDELNRIEEIVRKLLYFSKIRSMRPTEVNIHALLESITRVLAPEARKQRIRIRKDFALRNPRMMVDPSEMREVVLNLVSNSIEATPRGGVISLKTRPQKGDDEVSIIVEDTGKGILPLHVSKIFEPFFTTKESGVGLGLSIAYEIIRAHRGRLDYSQSADGGAKFTITLPRGNNNATMGRGQG